MNIYCGTDIVFIPRIKNAILKNGIPDLNNRFINKIYNKNEIEHILIRKDPFPGLAGRFAAKEAVIKAFSSIRKIINLKDIVVEGEIPSLKLMNNQDLKFDSSISISHDGDYAIAMVSVII